jgi:hypothetical protein
MQTIASTSFTPKDQSCLSSREINMRADWNEAFSEWRVLRIRSNLLLATEAGQPNVEADKPRSGSKKSKHIARAARG